MLMKKKILKKLVPLKKVPLEFRKFGTLDHSTYIEIPPYEEDFEVTFSENIGDLAFEDIILTRDSVYEKDGKDFTVKAGILLHIFRLNSESIGIGFHMQAMDLDLYVLAATYELNYRTGDYKLGWTPKEYRHHAENDMERTIADSLRILEILRSYERTSKPASTSYSIVKLPKALRDSYVEYVVDLSKPVVSSGTSGGGSHASPREHLRRGHYRTTKSGVRYFVRSTVVNEGSKGKVDKEYKV